jgi:oxalate decarboxylase
MIRIDPVSMKYGAVRIMDSTLFPAATTIAAALVEVEPGGMRELHWHPNADEWQYYIAGQARMTVFASGGAAQTFDYQAGDVGYVPRSMPHYLETPEKPCTDSWRCSEAPNSRTCLSRSGWPSRHTS